MKTLYGVSMTTPINQKLKNGHTMFDWIVRKKGFPTFCLRTLCGENPITAEEMTFMKDKGCSLGLVMRDVTEAEVSRSSGDSTAERAALAAMQLGVPQNENKVVFVEIKPDWSVNHNWMLSFAQAMLAKGYFAGFIGNTDSSKNFNFDRQCSHYADFSKDMNYFGAVFMATEPKKEDAPVEWEPYCPSSMEREDMSLWACSETVFDNIVAEDVYARDESVLANML